LHDAKIGHFRTGEKSRVGLENTVLPNNDRVKSAKEGGQWSEDQEREGGEEYRKTPRVLMWAMREASSTDVPSPIVTRSGSVIIGSPPFGYKQTFFPIFAPRNRKYQTKY
jgi:hypothetical protein